MYCVTVVTVTYNAEETIEETLKSVLNQNYPLLEYVIMDGGSNDGTIPIVDNYKHEFKKKNIPFKVIIESDTGIFNAMNKSLDYVSGNYVLFLNSGDLIYDKDTVKHVADNILSNEIDIIYGDYYLYCGKYRKYVKSVHCSVLPRRMISTHQSFFIKTSLLKKEKYNEKYKMAADYDFFLRMYLNNYNFLHINIPVVYFLTGGVSQKKTFLTQKEILEIQGKNMNISRKDKIKFMLKIPYECLRKKLLNIMPEFIRYKRYEKV